MLRPKPGGLQRRRQFITLLGGAAFLPPRPAFAQQVGKLPTIGFLGTSTSSATGPWTTAFVRRLHDLGWIEGRTIAIDIGRPKISRMAPPAIGHHDATGSALDLTVSDVVHPPAVHRQHLCCDPT